MDWKDIDPILDISLPADVKCFEIQIASLFFVSADASGILRFGMSRYDKFSNANESPRIYADFRNTPISLGGRELAHFLTPDFTLRKSEYFVVQITKNKSNFSAAQPFTMVNNQKNLHQPFNLCFPWFLLPMFFPATLHRRDGRT